ncbi:MAG: hypothetical protein CVT66_06260 [Actinobacteria bacterium HGW-Actinobacteria-6]|nr:MAG: hypothetical protein CVT66_06260 [Actinobacteria bacterium HGW-Actinobacteria-6]
MALTTATEVAVVLKYENAATDVAFLKAYAAAERWIARRCRWKTETVTEDGEEITRPVDVEDLVQAVILLTGRYLARRNSPDGLLNMGELGVMRVGAIDRDVQSLTGPYRKIMV